MTDTEAEQFWNELVEHFGDYLPNPEHEPRRFAMCVKLLKYYKEQRARLEQ
jgi:hypothetical protein